MVMVLKDWENLNYYQGSGNGFCEEDDITLIFTNESYEKCFIE